ALNVWLIPYSISKFHDLQWSLRNSATSVMLQEGIFNQVVPGLTVYVRARDTAGELLGVIVHDTRNPLRAVTMIAERGAILKSAEGENPKVLLINGTRQQVSRGSTRLSLLYFDN